MVYLGGYEQGFSSKTEYGNMSLEELFRLSVAHNGKLIGSSGHQWHAEFKVNHPRSEYFTRDNFAEDIMLATYIIEELAAALGQKAGDIQPARVRRLLIQNNSALHRFILSDHARVGTVQTPLTEEGFRTFKDLYWTEYAVELANMLIEGETFMSALSRQTQRVQAENGLLTKDDTLIIQLGQVTPGYKESCIEAQALLSEAGYDIDIDEIIGQHMSRALHKAVYTALTQKGIMKLIDNGARQKGIWDKLAALEDESETGTISISQDFWEVQIANNIFEWYEPFPTMYKDALLNKGFLNRDDLVDAFKNEASIKNDKVEKALIDWCYAFNVAWTETTALEDQWVVIEEVALKALDDKLKDEIIGFLENTYGFDIQR